MNKNYKFQDIENNEFNKSRGNGISMIFQDPMTSINPVYNIGNQIILIQTIAGKKSLYSKN